MSIHAFDFLEQNEGGSDGNADPLPRFIAVFGDEPFLSHLVTTRICDLILGTDEDAAPFAQLDGNRTAWRDLADELTTVSLFGGSTRLVTVDSADDFVTANRPQLERWAEKPTGSGTLVLRVKPWSSNTRLAKQVDKTGLAVDCRPPQRNVGRRKVLDEARLTKWIVAWAKQRHQLKLTVSMAAMILDMIGPHLGLIDQELAKLALYADKKGAVTTEIVADNVGGWRTKTTWELLDAATIGNGADALRQLDQLIRAGESPLAMFGAFSWSLRRFAAATRVIQRAERQGTKPSLQSALLKAGFRKFPPDALKKAEASLRQMGRVRAGSLYRWLLETDLRMKGSHSAPDRARYVLEMLLIRLARELGGKPPQRRAS